MPTHPIKTQDCLPARPGGLAGGQQVSNLDETRRLQLVNGPMEDLFELSRGKMFECDAQATAARFAIRGPKARDWVSYPGRYWCGSHAGYRDECAWTGFERVSSWLGKRRGRPDLWFSAAASPGRFEDTRWLGLDFDFMDPPHPPDELMLEMTVDPDALAILTHYVEPHWMFTGGRSIHAHMFFEQAIPKETGRRLLDLLGQLLFPAELLSGVDSNLSNCLRLPLSKHHATGGLARYAGCRNENDVADYIEAIERDEAGEDEIEDLLIELEVLLVNRGGQRPKKRRRVKPAQRKTLDTVSNVIKQSTSKQSTPHSAPCSPTKLAASVPAASNLSALPDDIRQAAATIPFLVNHQRRSEFLTRIREGIPQDEFQRVIFDEPGFVTFVLIACGDRDRAYELLLDVAAKGVDPKRAANRRSRLRSTFHNFWPDFQNRGSGHNLESPSPKWIQETVGRLRQRMVDDGMRKDAVESLARTAQYCLTMLNRFPAGAAIGVRAVAAACNISIMMASRHLRLLRNDYPLLVLYQQEQYDPSQPDQRKAREWLLHREFVTQVLGVSLAYGTVLESASSGTSSGLSFRASTRAPALAQTYPSTGKCNSSSNSSILSHLQNQVFGPNEPSNPPEDASLKDESGDTLYDLPSTNCAGFSTSTLDAVSRLPPSLTPFGPKASISRHWSLPPPARGSPSHSGLAPAIFFFEDHLLISNKRPGDSPGAQNTVNILTINVEQSTILQERKSWVKK